MAAGSCEALALYRGRLTIEVAQNSVHVSQCRSLAAEQILWLVPVHGFHPGFFVWEGKTKDCMKHAKNFTYHPSCLLHVQPKPCVSCVITPASPSHVYSTASQILFVIILAQQIVFTQVRCACAAFLCYLVNSLQSFSWPIQLHWYATVSLSLCLLLRQRLNALLVLCATGHQSQHLLREISNWRLQFFCQISNF